MLDPEVEPPPDVLLGAGPVQAANVTATTVAATTIGIRPNETTTAASLQSYARVRT
jgi:hypothetical protein